MNLKQYESALSDFDNAIKLDPDFAKAYLYKAYTLLLQENYLESISVFTETIIKDPSISKAFINRGTAYMKTNNWEMAINDFTTGIAKENIHMLHFEQGNL
ncbi:MAG: tetratricopeptide repeat protein [Saprospiraceae bacterium]|nr:tetratricopeptide repeat protein [Saprospiraceae bacterium]